MSRKWSWLWIVVLAVSPWLAGCGTVPATGRSQFIMISRDQEVRLGAEARDEFVAGYGGEIQSAQIRNYVRDVGAKIVEATRLDPEPWDVPWEFIVLDSATVNAFAIPGGKVFITRGMLSRMNSEAQLAGILGHEAGHVTGRHSARIISNQYAIAGVVTMIGVFGELQDSDVLRGIGVGAQVGGTVFALSFSRSHELEADQLGLRYMTRAGYDPEGLIEVFEILKSLQGGAAGPEWLSTHPTTDRRIAETRALIQEQHPELINGQGLIVGRDRFQQNVLAPLRALPPPRHRP
ncbi:MAG: M48 family metalloprotease [Phycisphaeraceae bacterium]|nr:M48 family metalloprotease [Phycisphaeraceae bacterium]